MAVTHQSFNSRIFPPEVLGQVLNAGLDSAPFAGSLNRRQTSTGSIVYATVKPDSFAWLHELDQYPSINLHDTGVLAAVAKIGGIFGLSDESVADATFDLLAELARAVGASLSGPLDDGLLYGSGSPQPSGLLTQVTATAGTHASLFAGAIASLGEMKAAGMTGTATVYVSPSAWATEAAALSTQEVPLHPDGLTTIAGAAIVAVPALEKDHSVLVADPRAVDLVLGHDSQAAVSNDFYFDTGQIAVRVDARVAIGCPTPGKSARKFTVT